jgi:hypothetical protein
MYRKGKGHYHHRGYDICRGGYVDTPDDRLDGWYVDHHRATMADRRGPGFPTLEAATLSIDHRRRAAVYDPS